MDGRAVSNSYAVRANKGGERRRIAARSFGSAFAMNEMTYNEELCSVAQQPSRGPQATASFQRPGPDVLSETIPVVFVGRNHDGFWVARDAEAKFGGLFWRKQAALDFARKYIATHAVAIGYAAVFPQARFELDMPNQGNPLVDGFGFAKRLLARPAQRLIAVTRKLLSF
jgi:hypothetical protein